MKQGYLPTLVELPGVGLFHLHHTRPNPTVYVVSRKGNRRIHNIAIIQTVILKFLSDTKGDDNRFWSKVDKKDQSECWEWTAAKTKGGYGRFRDGQRLVVAHRYSYELKYGPIPEGLELDHTCHNSSCVNPDHLEVVTHSENIRRRYIAEIKKNNAKRALRLANTKQVEENHVVGQQAAERSDSMCGGEERIPTETSPSRTSPRDVVSGDAQHPQQTESSMGAADGASGTSGQEVQGFFNPYLSSGSVRS